jgi:hypothetical protein
VCENGCASWGPFLLHDDDDDDDDDDDVLHRFAGLLKGIGKGLVGAVAAPVVGTLGAFSRVTEGVDATVRIYTAYI